MICGESKPLEQMVFINCFYLLYFYKWRPQGGWVKTNIYTTFVKEIAMDYGSHGNYLTRCRLWKLFSYSSLLIYWQFQNWKKQFANMLFICSKKLDLHGDNWTDFTMQTSLYSTFSSTPYFPVTTYFMKDYYIFNKIVTCGRHIFCCRLTLFLLQVNSNWAPL